jgi:hypothetical protein
MNRQWSHSSGVALEQFRYQQELFLTSIASFFSLLESAGRGFLQ